MPGDRGIEPGSCRLYLRITCGGVPFDIRKAFARRQPALGNGHCFFWSGFSFCVQGGCFGLSGFFFGQSGFVVGIISKRLLEFVHRRVEFGSGRRQFRVD
jgi:hypothetical protein